MASTYCEILGIDTPALERVVDHPDANIYGLLIVALLERGSPMTLAEVAERFAEAGVAPAPTALRSLSRCRPARAPVYRDGTHYALDPRDDELDLWAFRLGLRPPKHPRLRVVRPEPEPLPGPDAPLTPGVLDEAWHDRSSSGWSAQRIALAILDAHGRAMLPVEVIRFADERMRSHPLSEKSQEYWRRGSAVRVRDDGLWELDSRHPALISARKAVRARVETARRWSAQRPDPVVLEANRQLRERERAASAAEFASLRRVLVHAFPATRPEAVVLVDVGEREVATFFKGELDDARERIATYDLIAAVDVRATLRALAVDPGDRRLSEIGPPQKTTTLNRAGRKLKITLSMLIQNTCNISRPLGEKKKLAQYLREGQTTRLRRRLESDAKSLFAFYQYGRLHGSVRLRWGFLDDMLPVSWVYWDEERLYGLQKRAHEEGRAIEVVTGTAPGWSDPWARARHCRVSRSGYGFVLEDGSGDVIDEREVQAARVV